MATMLVLSYARCSSSGPPAFAMHYARRATLQCSGSASFSTAADNNDYDDSVVGNNGDDRQSTNRPPKTRRRTRRRTIQSPDGGNAAIPSLAEFMHRAKVLKQYRNFVKLAQFVDGKDANDGVNSSGECRAALEEVRLSYKLGMKKDVDALAKKMAHSEGERRMRELEAMVGYSPNVGSKESNALSPQSIDEDSWINIKDEEDPRGRVGVQWPWEKDGEKSK